MPLILNLFNHTPAISYRFTKLSNEIVDLMKFTMSMSKFGNLYEHFPGKTNLLKCFIKK